MFSYLFDGVAPYHYIQHSKKTCVEVEKIITSIYKSKKLFKMLNTMKKVNE